MDYQGRRKVHFLQLERLRPQLQLSIQLAIQVGTQLAIGSFVASYISMVQVLVLVQLYLYVIYRAIVKIGRYRPSLASLFYEIQFITPYLLVLQVFNCINGASKQQIASLVYNTDLYHSAFQIYHLAQLMLVITIACRHLFHV